MPNPTPPEIDAALAAVEDFVAKYCEINCDETAAVDAALPVLRRALAAQPERVGVPEDAVADLRLLELAIFNCLEPDYLFSIIDDLRKLGVAETSLHNLNLAVDAVRKAKRLTPMLTAILDQPERALEPPDAALVAWVEKSPLCSIEGCMVCAPLRYILRAAGRGGEDE